MFTWVQNGRKSSDSTSKELMLAQVIPQKHTQVMYKYCMLHNVQFRRSMKVLLKNGKLARDQGANTVEDISNNKRMSL